MRPLTSLQAGGASSDIPWDIREAAELWARENGTHAKVVWNPVLGCAEVQLEWKPDDPRWERVRAGTTKVPPYESVYLHRWSKAERRYVAIPLAELGASGLRNLLDEGNMQSGNGRYRNIYEAVKAVDEKNQKLKEKRDADIVEAARLNARDKRREVFDLPLVSVPVDLEK